MVSLMKLALSSVGVFGAAGLLRKRWEVLGQQAEKNRELLRLAAVALSSEVVDNVLVRNEDSLGRLVSFVKDVSMHPSFINHLKAYAITEFTANEQTVRALRKFVVEDLICDSWVADELVSMAKDIGRDVIADPQVYPTPVLRFLGDAALDGLQTDTFKEELMTALKDSLWKAFLGPPPDHMYFLDVR
ncbi:hypothetical protein DPX39_060046600 [Trypanosoma brucei equiperdum]|uniref:Uncharacterized protein n=1 Tax=Trypanosoma brucei equiperdum TaxID=630700 RepID=A0A3L6L745_9TRYP|nr:hypothetical protein DPX39_060046600 [Trypanosoma brucei equiperdum]